MWRSEKGLGADCPGRHSGWGGKNGGDNGKIGVMSAKIGVISDNGKMEVIGACIPALCRIIRRNFISLFRVFSFLN